MAAHRITGPWALVPPRKMLTRVLPCRALPQDPLD